MKLIIILYRLKFYFAKKELILLKKLFREEEKYLDDKLNELIKKVEDRLNVKILGYIMEKGEMIEYEDPESFCNFLLGIDISKKKKILLILVTTGGYIEPVLKIINTLNYYGNGDFEVFIPNLSKSAGTVLCLGASKIYMGVISEIGPVDTQIDTGDSMFSAKDYCDSYDKIIEKISNFEIEKENEYVLTAYFNQHDKFDNILLEMCEKANVRVKNLTEEILNNNKSYHKDPDKIEKITDKLTYGFLDHSDVIDWKKAKAIGLEVETLNPDEILWKELIEIYERARNFMRKRDIEKIFFSYDDMLMVSSKKRSRDISNPDL